MFFKRNRPIVLQITAFIITALIYSMLHASRTAWAYSKPTLIEDLNYGESTLGWLDCAFLFSYGFGLFVNGWLGDRLKLKILLSVGILSTIFALIIFSITEGFLNFKTLFFGIPLFILNGLGQSTVKINFIRLLFMLNRLFLDL